MSCGAVYSVYQYIVEPVFSYFLCELKPVFYSSKLIFYIVSYKIIMHAGDIPQNVIRPPL